MASLQKTGTRWVIQWRDRTGRLRTISLGVIPKHVALKTFTRVEALIACNLANVPPDPQTAEWLRGVSDRLRRKLASKGLTEAGVSLTVEALFADYLRAKKPSLKPGSMARLKQAEKAAVEHLGGQTPIVSITEADAAAFRDSLLSGGLAENTVRKRCGDVRAVFARAVGARMLDRNPFAAIPVTVGGRSNRTQVSEAESRRIMAELPDPSWRLLFALARWGGIRVPSEVQDLRWEDVAWDAKRITIRQPKKARHMGEPPIRVLPLFPELEKPLLDVLEHAKEGDPLVLPRFRGVNSAGMRTTPLRAIKRAGVKPWKALWQSLRSTRATELISKHRYPESTVVAWIGNTPAIARKHYLDPTEDEYRRAARGADTGADTGADITSYQ